MARVVPVINCPEGDTACVAGKLSVLRAFSRVAHLDIADHTFTPTRSGITPEGWKALGEKDIDLEVHVMVADPAAVVPEWLAVGAKRVIVHIETLGDNPQEKIRALQTVCEAAGAGFVLGIGVEGGGSPEAIPKDTAELCVLAVHPGPAGQELLPETFAAVRALRSRVPHAHIEIDGGVTPETAQQLRAAGADSMCAGTYIFSAADPQAAYAELMNAVQ